MLELLNKTPFHLGCTPLTNLEGYEELSVFLAASFTLEKGQWVVSGKQLPTPMGDTFWDPDAPSSIRYPGQLTIGKPATDIIINGAAIAPASRPVTALQASVEIGTLKAKVNVYGERVWHRGRITEPQSFERIPLVWENAFGGTHRAEDTVKTYDHNAYGKGWLPKGAPEAAYNGFALPNVERPEALIRRPQDNPLPAGFGALSVDTPTRAQYAGTYDQQWQTTRAPFLPLDFDPRFFNAAIPALQYNGFMSGNEPVRLRNLNNTSELVFQVPRMTPAGEVVMRNGTCDLAFRLLTLVIESETLTLRLFWQALAPIPRTLADVYQIKVSLAR